MRISVANGVEAALFLLAVLAILFPSVICSYDPLSTLADDRLQPPGLRHILGTDQFGRDILARLLTGASSTLSSGGLAVGIGFGIGVPMGVVAGMAGGPVEVAIMLATDILIAIPELFAALSLVTLIGTGIHHVAIAVGVSQVAGFVRLTRNEVVTVRDRLFVTAAYDIGGTFWAVLWRHVLPNCMAPALSLLILRFAAAIIAISTICFLGYGPPPPTPEWGLMISEGRDYIAAAWWLTAVPGLAIVGTVLAMNRLANRVAGRT